MESFDNFIELFKKWKNERNNSDLTDILKNGRSYFRDLSTNEIGLALYVLLDNKTGLLHLLDDATDKSMESSIVEGFKLLNFIVQEFHRLLDQYIIGIKKVCQSAIISKSSQFIKTAAADCFESLLKKCPSNDLSLNETVQTFVKAFHLCSDADRAKFFKALGSIAKYEPEAISPANAKTIFERVMNDFGERHGKLQSGSQPSEIAIYLETLDNLMGNFSPQENRRRTKDYETLYRYIKELSNIDLGQTIKFVSRAGIALLGNRMYEFIDFVYGDALYWHKTLLNWTKLPGDNGAVAFNTLSIYYELLGEILRAGTTGDGRAIFEHLKLYFERNFTNDNVDSISLRLSICGLGHIAGACKTYLNETDVEDIFSLIARKTTIMYANNNETNGPLEDIAYYQVALSKILLSMSAVSSDQLTALSTLSLILIKRFPELPISSHSLAVKSLMETIYHVKEACRRSYGEFLQKLVYEGIIWSCSHALFVDAEREHEMKNLDERPICYKNYLPLWRPLIRQKKILRKTGVYTIPTQIFENMIEACVRLIKKLNLDVKTVDASGEIEDFDVPIAVNDTDFRVFVNLVDLVVAILEKLEPEVMDSKMDWFFCEMIRRSNQNPLISGFYKLVQAVLKLYNLSFDSGEQKLLDETCKLLSKYLSDTIDRLSHFSGELQASCFNLIFEIPVSIAENMLDRLVSVFKTAFSLGQSNFDIAQSALDTIAKWTKTLRGERVNIFLIGLIPSLESFLLSNESTVDIGQDILLNKRKVIKNIVLTDHENTLQEFQRKILLFFGSLNSEVTSNLTVQRYCSNGTLGDDRNLLKYTLLYRDIKPDIYLDTILPRTIELALESTDRRTRVVACEVLHSIIIVMLGSGRANSNRLLPIFKKIFPVILRLGSDSDQVIQQLFYPLTIQLTHWYSSKMMLHSSETVYLIEILFDLLTYESNVALSDFCGVCLAEFVNWSIKQSTDNELQTSSTNIAAIMNKITNFASHTSVQKRIGAAVAFNYLYTILRESNVIIDIFWMELLFCFVKSLDGCNGAQINKSLKHVERVIENRHELLNKPSSQRRKPVEFEGTLLKDAVDWLLLQCGSLDVNCRSKSMELLEKISKHVPVYGSVPNVFADYINTNGVRGLNKIILKDLHPKIEKLSIESMKPLLRTLDCYIWILNGDIINLDLLFTDKNANKDMIFNCIINFVYLINVKKEENETASEFSKLYQDLSVLKCEIILQIFNFIKILLNKMDIQTGTSLFSYVPTFFWNEELYSLISTLIFKPEVIGFDMQNLAMTESLPSSLEQLLNTFVTKVDNKHISQLKISIVREIESRYEDFFNFDQILKNDTSVTLKNYLKGLIMLETIDESGKLYERPINEDNSVEKIREIFNLLKEEQYGGVVAVHLKSSEKEYLENLMEFLFFKCESNAIKTLVDIADTRIELSHENSMITSHGEYFMSLFGPPVFKNLLKHLSKSMDILLNDTLTKAKFDAVATILEDLLSYVKRNKQYSEELLSNLEKKFVQRFPTLRNEIGGSEKRNEKVISLYSTLVQVSKNPCKICSEPNELYSWIMQGLLGYLDLDYKTRMLNNFLPCIVDETEHKSQELIHCLHKLKTDYFTININDLAKGSLNHSNLIASFQTLVRHLPTLKSVALFDCIIHLTIGNIGYLWDDSSTKYLTAYFNKISTDDSQRSLIILYKYFMNTENFNSRLEILKYLLLKCIHFCDAKAIEYFFEQNIKEIHEIVSQDLFGNGPAPKNLIVSKIGCYNLLEIMFAKVPYEKLTTTDSEIVKNSMETIETGKELLKALNDNALNVRQLKSDDTESKELIRLLHCAAYNCSISIVSLKVEERFYVLPFAENRGKGQLIWENIVDGNRIYDFKQDFKEIPKEYKKLINIRKQSNLKQAHSDSYLKSYNLAASTLNEDLSCFDLYEANLRPAENGGEEEMMCLTFECDDLNNHECMASICGVITHMVSRNISNLPKDGEDLTMPKWMECFKASINATIIYNVKFFMMKVIVNLQDVFKPYGKFFLTPILNFLKLHFRNNRKTNYVIKDILVMLIDWRDVAIPSQNTDKPLAHNLIEMLIKNADSNRRQIYKYNVEIIDMLVEAWKTCLEVPREILKIKNLSTKLTVRMILTFLRANDQQESLGSRRDVLEYLADLFDNPDEEIVLHACNAFGMILNYLESKNEDDKKEWIVDKIKTLVINRSEINQNKYIKCIYEIHRFYPSVMNDCYTQLTSNFFKVDHSNKEKCLELFLTALPNFTDEEIITELGFIKFQDILINKILSCQRVALKIIEKLLNILSPSDYLPFALLVVPYSKDVSVTQREIVMDIFIAVYKKYKDNIEDNIATDKLKDLSKRILLLGLLDANESLQKKLLHFWTEDGNLTDKSTERMLEIFNMYDNNLESNYLPIIPLMMLHLVSKDPAFKKPMFEPLINCKFEDYQVAITWRAKHAGLLAPLFTSSLASQMSQYYSKSNPTFARLNQSLNQSLFLRASQSLQFQQTVFKDQSFRSTNEVENEFNDSYVNVDKIPPPSKNKKSKRILHNTTDMQDNMRQKQISINLRRNEMLKEETDRQRNSIRMHRKYRIGDFPDVEITHSTLIEPLQELIKNDQVIARDLTVAMFSSMLKEMSSDQKTEFLQQLSLSLELILDKTQGSKPLIATVLEIILNSYEIHIDSNVITKVAKSCGLLSLGALLLEEKMISRYTDESPEPAAKRSRYETQTYNNGENDWLQLAYIYKSMNDFDIVQSIFGCEKFGKELQQASSAQAASKWGIAKFAYENAYTINEGLVRDYCQESLYICLAHLSDWKQINQHINSELNGDFDALWEKPMNENWMVSWILEAQIHGILRNNCDEAFLKALNGWVDTRDKLLELKSSYGEEIAIFYMDQNPEFAENCLTSGLEKIRQEWKHLNPLYHEQKINKYPKLRGLSDIKTFLKGIKNGDELIPNLQSMLDFWDNSKPSNHDNLLLWDKHIAYRLYFFGLLKQRIEVNESNETNGILDAINDAFVKQCLNIAQAAYGECNPQFMKKYLRYSEPYLRETNTNLSNEWLFGMAKYKYLCYMSSKSQEKRVNNCIASWKQSHKLLENDCINTQIQMDIRQHISHLVIELQKLLISSEPIGNILLENQSILQYLPPRHEQESILKQLSDYCLKRLTECCETEDSMNKAGCYLQISKYCHSMNGDFESGLDLSKEFVHSTLSAMSYGSSEATQYFPCLLHLDYSENPELGQVFERASEKVETWMYLKWQAQLLSHIGTSLCSLISPILLRLAETYPNSIIYTFRMTKEMNKSSSTDPLIEKLTHILSENKDLELFLEAIKYVVQPELYLKYHLSALEGNTSVVSTNPVDTLLNTVYPSTEDQERIQLKGKVYRSIDQFEERIKKMLHMEGRELLLCKKQIINDLDESLNNRMNDRSEVPLKDYSPWLCNFTGGNIEVPGQYVADKRPLPTYHTKIVKLNPSVKILPSLRKPVKITMLGNDGKNYNFLVKFGEDLRTDERIEQLFTLMNKILQGDTVCRQRRLSIDTYLVIPLNVSLGLIQWVENTRSLNEIINMVLTNEQKKERGNIIKSYISWMSNLGGGQPIEVLYNKGILKYDRREVTTKFDSLKTRMDWAILRKAFKQLSVSPESFFALRHNFITSYATICIAQWILGIGDRNLSNTLISYGSGKALGIDFGYSFDAAIDSSIPELMPFRLTPQILGLLQPFDENGLLKVTMSNVLRAIKNGKDPLLACMDIFVKEPSLDWLPRKRILEERQEASDVKWYPKKKIDIVVDKLNGAKPSKLTLVQIKERYGDTECFSKYIDIINGSNDGLQLRIRSERLDENLSIEEQVECLLDQATDPNILARTYYGWEPWM